MDLNIELGLINQEQAEKAEEKLKTLKKEIEDILSAEQLNLYMTLPA